MTEACHTIKPACQEQGQQPLIRVIGIGSAHGADQIGWLACERLQTSMMSNKFDWQLCRTPAQLPQLVQDCDAVVIIDATLNAGQAGQVISLAWPIQHHDHQSLCSSHALNVLEAMQLASILGKLPCHTYLLAVTTANPDHDAMTVVDNAIPQLQHELNCIVNRIDASGPHDR